MTDYTEADLHRIANAKSHREAYPDQYTHSLVGKLVDIHCNAKEPEAIAATGRVERVFQTMWGQMAKLEGISDTYWLAKHCKVKT